MKAVCSFQRQSTRDRNSRARGVGGTGGTVLQAATPRAARAPPRPLQLLRAHTLAEPPASGHPASPSVKRGDDTYLVGGSKGERGSTCERILGTVKHSANEGWKVRKWPPRSYFPKMLRN